MRNAFTASGFVCALISGAFGFNCAPHAGSVPMAGHRNPSTACVFGLRGVRVAMDDAELDAVDLTIRMSANDRGLAHCAHSLLSSEAPPASDSLLEQSGPKRAEISERLAAARIQNIPGGVHIHIAAANADNTVVIRDELVARLERAASESRCD